MGTARNSTGRPFYDDTAKRAGFRLSGVKADSSQKIAAGRKRKGEKCVRCKQGTKPAEASSLVLLNGHMQLHLPHYSGARAKCIKSMRISLRKRTVLDTSMWKHSLTLDTVLLSLNRYQETLIGHGAGHSNPLRGSNMKNAKLAP
jgi:hypothetical protein